MLKSLTLLIVLSISQANADTNNRFDKLKDNFANCSEKFDKREEDCPEKWSYKCVFI